MPKISAERKEATRRRLVDAAVEVIRTSGYEAATTRKILEVAGLSAGALYHYFDSKDELLEAIAQRFADQDDGLLGLAADTDGPAAARHHAAVLGALFGSRQDTLLSHLRPAALSSEPVREALHHYDRMVVTQSAASNRVTQQLGVFRDDFEPEALAEIIQLFWESFVIRDRAGGFVAGRDRVLGLFFEMLRDRVLAAGNVDADALFDQLRAIAP